jgi:hypothetical protein
LSRWLSSLRDRPSHREFSDLYVQRISGSLGLLGLGGEMDQENLVLFSPDVYLQRITIEEYWRSYLDPRKQHERLGDRFGPNPCDYNRALLMSKGEIVKRLMVLGECP